MPTNQKYSSRILHRRQLVSTDTHLTSCVTLLTKVGLAYAEAAPEVSIACNEMVKMIAMITAMVEDIRNNI